MLNQVLATSFSNKSLDLIRDKHTSLSDRSETHQQQPAAGGIVKKCVAIVSFVEDLILLLTTNNEYNGTVQVVYLEHLLGKKRHDVVCRVS